MKLRTVVAGILATTMMGGLFLIESATGNAGEAPKELKPVGKKTRKGKKESKHKNVKHEERGKTTKSKPGVTRYKSGIMVRLNNGQQAIVVDEKAVETGYVMHSISEEIEKLKGSHSASGQGRMTPVSIPAPMASNHGSSGSVHSAAMGNPQMQSQGMMQPAMMHNNMGQQGMMHNNMGQQGMMHNNMGQQGMMHNNMDGQMSDQSDYMDYGVDEGGY